MIVVPVFYRQEKTRRLAVEAACRRLGIAPPTHGKATLYSGQVEGLLVSLPDWTYPVVINTTTGEIAYDNYLRGAMGRAARIGRLPSDVFG